MFVRFYLTLLALSLMTATMGVVKGCTDSMLLHYQLNNSPTTQVNRND